MDARVAYSNAIRGLHFFDDDDRSIAYRRSILSYE